MTPGKTGGIKAGCQFPPPTTLQQLAKRIKKKRKVRENSFNSYSAKGMVQTSYHQSKGIFAIYRTDYILLKADTKGQENDELVPPLHSLSKT